MWVIWTVTMSGGLLENKVLAYNRGYSGTTPNKGHNRNNLRTKAMYQMETFLEF